MGWASYYNQCFSGFPVHIISADLFHESTYLGLLNFLKHIPEKGVYAGKKGRAACALSVLRCTCVASDGRHASRPVGCGMQHWENVDSCRHTQSSAAVPAVLNSLLLLSGANATCAEAERNGCFIMTLF